MKTTLSRNPVYNIKSVSEQTGIPPVTLRAWERRYGFPAPQRGESGYRLFSEYDIAAVNWLKEKTGEGMTIAQAVKLLLGLIERGEDPLVRGMLIVRGSGHQEFRSIEEVQPALVRALIAMDEKEAHRIGQAAFSMFPVEQVLTEIVQPTLIEIGDRWHSGEISIATEHFASHQCSVMLHTAFEATANIDLRGSIVASCAPGELHELGLLTLCIMLRSRGWKVTYLGANISLDRFAEAVEPLKPQMLLFSAATPATASGLNGLEAILEELPEPTPIIGLGGQAFQDHPALANRIPGTIFGPDADLAISQIERMLTSMNGS